MKTEKLSVAEQKQRKSESLLGFVFVFIIALVMAGFFFFLEAFNEVTSQENTTAGQTSMAMETQHSRQGSHTHETAT